MDINRQALVKNLLAGLLIGGGITAPLLLGRHLMHMKDRAARTNDWKDNRIKVTIDDPGLHKNQSKGGGDNAVSAALSFLALLLGGAGGAALANKGYHSFRKNQLNRELGQAQNRYITLAQNEGKLRSGLSLAELEKHASSDFSMLSKVMATPMVFSALVALASGIVTNRLLEQQFPQPVPAGKNQPKELDLEIRRTASSNAPQKQLSVSDNEMLMKHSLTKKASSLNDLVYAVAEGRGPALRESVLDTGWDTTFEMCKNASAYHVPNWRKNLAIHAIACDPVLAPGAATLGAAEYYDSAEGFCKVASWVEDEDLCDDLADFHDLYGTHLRTQVFTPILSEEGLQKSAAVSGAVKARAGRLLPTVLVAELAMRKLEQGKERDKAEISESDEKRPDLVLSSEDVETLKQVLGPDFEKDLLYGDPVQEPTGER